MRVAIVSRIYRPEPSAASFFLGAVADALIADGHDVDVLTARPPREFHGDAHGERLRTFPVVRDRNGYVRGYVPYLSFDVPLIFRLLFTRRPDVVLVEPPPTTGAVVRLVCGIRRVPYVYDAADVWSDAADMATGSRTVIRVLRSIERFAMRGAAHLVTISQGVIDRVRNLGVARPITVTGFGADTGAFTVAHATPEPLFVYAGSYSTWHGAEVLIDALARLHRTHPSYRLRIIGNGERRVLEARARELGVHAAVDFVEAIPPAQLAPHLASAVATLATLKPGTGYDYAFASKAYSSLAAGCPVIFAGPGPTAAFIDEANGHARAGTAVAYDAAAIAEAMRAFADKPLTEPERDALGAWTAAEHSMAAVGRRVAGVVEAVGRGTRSHDGGLQKLISAPVDWMVRHRSAMPPWVDRLMESVARNPDGPAGRLASRLLGGGSAPVTSVPEKPTRVYIAPTNYSGQGYQWARALERADPDIGARNAAVVLPGGFAFPADTSVPVATVNASTTWQESEWQAARRFTHVLVEAERSMFGRRFGRNLADEILALEDAGVSVAYLCHGTDIRRPDRHAELTSWSPYPEDSRTGILRSDAEANLELLTRLPRPTFISTPDLAHDVPWATWCPVVIDAAAFAVNAEPFTAGPIRIVHAATAPVQKGSHYIEPALEPLARAGTVDYRLITGTPSAQMPAVFAGADIVLDQFRLGSYGVAACEAMAAGRVVVGHVLPFVRDRIEREFGMPLPIVEATPDTLHDTIARLAEDRDAARAIAAAGSAYVEAVHSGPASARALIEHWIRPGDEGGAIGADSIDG